jgi:hypothetical protein
MQDPAGGAHRLAKVRVEAVGQFHNTGRDFVKVDGLLAPIALHDVHAAWLLGASKLNQEALRTTRAPYQAELAALRREPS